MIWLKFSANEILIHFSDSLQLSPEVNVSKSLHIPSLKGWFTVNTLNEKSVYINNLKQIGKYIKVYFIFIYVYIYL